MTDIMPTPILYAMNELFQSKRYQDLFALHQLDRFASIWTKQIDWFEKPNHRRGGWSGVGQITLESDQEELSVFVKKQQDHRRRTLLHPIKGEASQRLYFFLCYMQSKKLTRPLKMLCRLILRRSSRP